MILCVKLPCIQAGTRVCINQNDLIERSQQVSIMRAIYEGARNVLVWLGPHSNPDAAL
jgi:hypothetical protein